MDFSSDTSAPAHPLILEAMARASQGMAPSYGADDWCDLARQRLRDIFETDLEMFLVSSGTAANALALSVFCPPTGSVICHEEAHIERDERGAPEFFTGGAKLQLLGGPNAKIRSEDLKAALAHRNPNFVHETPAAMLSITNLTEFGTRYTAQEIAALSELAKGHGLHVHLDGARFANALVGSGSTPAELSWKSGVDILSFGATKNGALGCEAIILFGQARERYPELLARAKRAGHMPAKMRYLGAQMTAYLDGEFWLERARHANAMAQRLAGLLCGLKSVTLAQSVDGNEVFAHMSDTLFHQLVENGLKAYRWHDGSVRFLCNWSTSEKDINKILLEIS
ncbi:MAG: threonine aldolase [Ponticaulis sp.]|nr:threonine aldolase [Ponticaulis sp.]